MKQNRLTAFVRGKERQAGDIKKIVKNKQN